MTRTDPTLAIVHGLAVLAVLGAMAAYELRFRWLAHECGAGVEHACHLLRVNGRAP